jgi:hypothetical protein
MRRLIAAAAAGLICLSAGLAYAAANHFKVRPHEFAPLKTKLVQSAWLAGIGCPTNARTAATIDFERPSGPGPNFTDPACATGDPKDKSVEGLLLAKTGPTSNFASAQAIIQHPPSTITELGWDIRKPGTELSVGLRGSHCGAGAPRWNIRTASGQNFFIGCNSPPATTQVPGVGWIRMRWGAGTLAFRGAPPFDVVPLSTLQVRGLRIVFDEGQDAGPSNFGLAVLDNITVNGQMTGKGPTQPGIKGGQGGQSRGSQSGQSRGKKKK